MKDDKAHQFCSIVRADVLLAQKDADAIVADARAEASRIRSKLENERIEVLEEARRVGLGMGVQEAAMIVAGATRAINDFWREQEANLADIAFAIAHRIVTSLPAEALLAQIVSTALADYDGSDRLTLRAAPEAATSLREALRNSTDAKRVTVVADPAAAPGECTLSHARGRTNIGLLDQFRAMINGLSDRDIDAERGA